MNTNISDGSMIQEIKSQMEAMNNFIYITTFEESRAIIDLCKVADEMGLYIESWTLTSVVYKYSIKKDELIREPVTKERVDLMEMLDRIRKAPGNAIFILRDLNDVFDPAIAREFRNLEEDLAYEISRSNSSNTFEPKYVVGLAPSYRDIPETLQKTFSVIEYKLPTFDYIMDQLEKVVTENFDSDTQKEYTKDRLNQLARGLQGMTESEITSVVAQSIVNYNSLHLDSIIKQKQDIIKKSGILEFYNSDTSYEDIGGLTALKKWLETRKVGLTERAIQFGLPIPKGILIAGIPGTGKSLVCKTIANSWHMPLIKMDIGRIMSGRVGSSEANMRNALKTLESIAPCVLWIDEIEKSLAGTSSSDQSDAGTTARVFSTLLTWLNDKTAPVFVVATANNVASLPPEFTRKGRFDEMFFVNLPTPEERAEIIKIHLRKRKVDPTLLDINVLVEGSDNMTGSEIEQGIINAMFEAFVENDNLGSLDTKTIQKAFSEIVPIMKSSSAEMGALQRWSKDRARSASN